MNWKKNDIEESYSPNRKSKLTFYEFEEPRMMMDICKASFTNLIDQRIFDFDQVCVIDSSNKGKWSENSRYFLLPIALPTECFIVGDIENLVFTCILFKNCWVLNGHIFNDRIEIEYRDDQIPERIEHDKYPTKYFSKPDNLNFKFSNLKWLSFRDLADVKINTMFSVVDFEPIDNGWREFKGEFPATTDLIVWNLKKFAEYGDEQSKIWLEKIQSQTKSINYWDKASNYLGVKKRKPHKYHLFNFFRK